MKRAQLSEVTHTNAADVPYQETSLDIWDKKYRLKAKDGTHIDKNIDATYTRVAKAIAEVETTVAKQKKMAKRIPVGITSWCNTCRSNYFQCRSSTTQTRYLHH